MLMNENEEKELFQLADEMSGELEPYNNPSKVLNKDSVYVLMDNALRKIFLWIGQSAGVRARFIASNAAQHLQRLKGLTYRVVTVDQGEETSEFISVITPLVIPDQFGK